MSIPALLSRIVFVNLQKRLSISVPCLSENLVGSVIWGYILCDSYYLLIVITCYDLVMLRPGSIRLNVSLKITAEKQQLSWQLAKSGDLGLDLELRDDPELDLDLEDTDCALG